jgi:hypothetical protein
METKALNLKENLKDRFVAFIDVMGFSNLVNKGNTSNLEEYFLKIIDVLEHIRKDKGEIQSFLISDAIILITPIGLKGLKDIIKATRRIQSSLLSRKILLRGAISHGLVDYNPDNNIIVGKGFIRAYLLEQEAIYPRVIIDPSIIKLVSKDKEGFMNVLHNPSDLDMYVDNKLIYSKSEFSLINDDCIFVDYANKIILQNSLNGNMKKIYETIIENLYDEQRLYSKYVWLKDYFLERLKITHCFLRDTGISPTIPKHFKEIEDWLNKFARL